MCLCNDVNAVKSITALENPFTAPQRVLQLSGGNKDSDWLDSPADSAVASFSDYLPAPDANNATGSTILQSVDITPENYAEKALQEIQNQSGKFFGGGPVPNNRQIAIVDAYRQMAGLPPLAKQSTLDFLARTEKSLTATEQIKQAIFRAGDGVEKAAELAQEVTTNLTNPLSLISFATLGVVGLIFFLRK